MEKRENHGATEGTEKKAALNAFLRVLRASVVLPILNQWYPLTVVFRDETEDRNLSIVICQ